MYGPGTECRVWNSIKTISSSVTSTHSDSVIIGLVSLPNKEPINCFMATLTSGKFVVEIEGTLDTASKLDGTSTTEGEPFAGEKFRAAGKGDRSCTSHPQ